MMFDIGWCTSINIGCTRQKSLSNPASCQIPSWHAAATSESPPMFTRPVYLHAVWEYAFEWGAIFVGTPPLLALLKKVQKWVKVLCFNVSMLLWGLEYSPYGTTHPE